MIWSEHEPDNWSVFAGDCGGDLGCDVIFEVAATGLLESASGARSEDVLARAKLWRWACRDREASSTGSSRERAAISGGLLCSRKG